MTRPAAAALLRPPLEIPSDRPPALAVDIERMTEPVEDVARAVEEIASASFTEGGFSVDEELTRPWSRIWLARGPDRAVAGFLIAWHVADEVHVIHVATHPDSRRQGAARALMEALLGHARERRSRLVLLEVRRSNRAAIALYRAHGFCAIGIRRAYYRDTDEDAVEMMLALDPTTGRALPGRDDLSLGDL